MLKKDVLLTGKILGGGVMPAGGVVASGQLFAPLNADPLLHSSTFVGSQLAAAATIGAITSEGLIGRARELGPQVRDPAVGAVMTHCPHLVTEVHGEGLLTGVDFVSADIATEFLIGLLDEHVIPCIVCLRLHVPHKSASDVYATLSDFERYPELSDAVQNVAVTQVSENRSVSRWEVTFRKGLLRWTEQDTFDPGALTITFRQLEGDLAFFDGSWKCVPASQGSEIVFSVRLDMGIPSLADALEPIAVRTLIDNTVSIVRGLVGSADVVTSDVAVPAGDRIMKLPHPEPGIVAVIGKHA